MHLKNWSQLVLKSNSLSLYIHWPFCVSKCPYCDFNSHEANSIDRGAWRRAYLKRLSELAEETTGRTIETVFFGGGTPSLMDAETIGAILNQVHQLWPVAPDLEITLEANPTTAEGQKFIDFAAAGINRLSIGVQSFDDSALKFLGRAHDAKEAKAAIRLASKTFERFSFDLIYALPGQTEAAWREQMETALKFEPEHLSVYQLTVEPGTGFHKAQVEEAEEDLGAQLYEVTQKVLDGAGLPAYEISNHARPGAECRHNLVYWQGGDYLGVGPGAHGRLTLDGITHATQEIPNPQGWLKAAVSRETPEVRRDSLAQLERAEEILMMGLRTVRGINAEDFEQQIQGSLQDFLSDSGVKTLQDENLIVWDSGNLKATAKGLPLLNGILATLLG